MTPPNNKATVQQAIDRVYSRHCEQPEATPKRHRNLCRLGWSLSLALPLLAGSASAADAPAATKAAPAPQVVGITKPAWLTDLSLGVKESYDDNVFFSGVRSSYYPAGTSLSKVPSSIALAVRNQSSFVTTVSPKIGVNFAPLLGDQKTIKILSLAYSPDFVVYHDESTENYNAHRVGTAIKGGNDDYSFSLDNGFNAIDGSEYGPLFPGGLNSAYATAAIRERRDQYQDRSTASFQYNIDKFFVRPTASMMYYDLNTLQLTKAQVGGQTGYQNYADRYDVNGGVDLGYKVMPKFATTVGYRYGHQYQQKYSHAIDPLGLSSSSDYQRILFGFEGTPVSWLDAKLQIGPDFRNYADCAAVDDRNPVTYYGEASLTATITKADSISFKYKQYQWVSSTGKVPYFDSTYDLTYRRVWTSHITTDFGARFLDSDYTSGLDATKLPAKRTPNARNDTQTTLMAGLTYNFNANVSANIMYSIDLGRNLEDGITNPSTREYDHNLVSIGANFKF